MKGNRTVTTKEKNGKIITIIKINGKKVKKYVTDKLGNYIKNTNYVTRESVYYGELTPLEIDHAMGY